MKKRKEHSHRVSTKPKHENLSWPGLKAKDHLSRVVTRAVKEVKETIEKEAWAANQIARVLDYVRPETAIKLVSRETRRRKMPISRSAKILLGLFETAEGSLVRITPRKGKLVIYAEVPA